MPTLVEIEPQALALSESERADLASRLLASLPPILDDVDGGIAEALRREKEAEEDPSVVLNLDEFVSGMNLLRGK